MKFVCERCQTKYSIADEKVRQKVLKIRCKTCENVITIRDAVVVTEPAAPRAEPPPAPTAPPARSVEWHLAINGQQTGPFGLSALVTRVLGIGRNDEVYVWNEHLDGWKEPKLVPEVAAEMRQRAAVSGPPSPPVRRSTPAGSSGPARSHAPVAARGARSSVSTPAVSGSSAAMAAAVDFAPAGENEDKTQISPLDASLLMSSPDQMAATKPQPSLKNLAANTLGLGKEPEAKRSLGSGVGGGLAATTTSPILPPTQGVATTASPILPPTNGHVAGGKKSGAHAATGLEALDFAPSLRAPSQATLDLPAAPAVEPPPSVNGQKNGVPAPVVGGTTSMLLSQVGARAAKPRHPAVKFAVVGGVLVGLVGVITAVSLSGAEKPLGVEEKVAVAPPPAAEGDPEAAARAEAEKYFKSMVGEPAASAPVTKSVGPVASRRPPPRPKAAEPSTPPPLAPPPVGAAPNPADTSRVSNRFGIGERKVSAPQKESRGGGDDFDISKFVAVFKQPDHHTAIKSCYERALKRDDNLKLARLDINVNVGETGSVKRVRVDAPTEFNAVSECIRDAVRRWRFPSNTKEYEAKFPLILQGKTE